MQSISFIKRILVIVYDALLLTGILFVCSTVFLLIPDQFEYSLLGRIIKVLYLLLISFYFFGWFWVNAGQTLGMKAWNLYLIDQNGKFINWKTAAIRYFSAILSWAACGLGFTWVLLNKRNLTWHDLLSKSLIVKHKTVKQKTK